MLAFRENSKFLNLSKSIKYIKAQCLKIHFKVYYSKIAEVIHNKKLLIHYFFESLVRLVLS